MEQVIRSSTCNFRDRIFGWSAAASFQTPTATRVPAYGMLRPEIIVHREIRGKRKA